MVIGRAAGTVSILPRCPPAATRIVVKHGRKRLTGSSSWNSPCSYSIITARLVSGLVME